MASQTDTILFINKLTERYGDDTTGKLVSYIDMVLDRNQHINLTAVRDRDEAMQKHLADSLAVTDAPEYQEAKRIIDVGTGAGFPGALLAIVSPEKEFVLLDSTLKRLRVIDEFAAELGIRNMSTVHARAEEISKKPEYNAAFDLCVSRAVASMDKLAGWCLPFVRKGGYFAAYKGENYESEILEARKSLAKFKGKVNRIIPCGSTDSDISGHVIVMIEKI